MRALVLRWSSESVTDVGATLRAAAAYPPPKISGLRSRRFAVEPGVLFARYHFDDHQSLETFSRAPTADPAVEFLARETVPSSVSVEDVASFDAFDRPIFLVAAPRAGRTLLYQLMAGAKQLWSVDRNLVEGIRGLHPSSCDWDSHELTDLHADEQTVQALRALWLEELRDWRNRRYLELSDSERPRRIRMVDQASENSLRIQFLAAAFPDARFVFIHRDARQSVSSLLEAWRDEASVSIPSLPGWQRGAWHGLLPKRWRDYRHASLLDVAAYQWAAANQRALDDLEWLAPGRWIAVDFSELIASHQAAIRRVFAFCELELDDALASRLAGSRRLAGVSPSSPIKWRDNPEFCESALTPHNVLRGRLRELGGPPAPPPPQRDTTGQKTRFAVFVDQLDLERPYFPPDRTGSLGAHLCRRIVHPSFHFQIGATVPIGLVQRTRFRDRFLPGFPIAWVEDEATNVLYPYWARREDVQVLRHFAAGRPAPSARHELTEQLVAARVLVFPEEIAYRRKEGNALAETARDRFERSRYCLLPSLIDRAHVAALRQYYDALIGTGNWPIGDAQVSQRYGWHNESVARFFHHQLCPFVGRIAGEPVRPSYCYVSAYRGTNVSLRPHFDRKQCAYTMSLWIGDAATGNRGPSEPWPLWFHSPDGIVSVTQSSGDAVLFRGCELPHWREQPPPGGASTTLIFHYVPKDFAGVLD